MKPARTVETFPLSRIGTFDVGVIGGKKHQITGLLEVDVTTARARLRAMRRQGTAASFFACFVKTAAHTIGEVPQVHGMLRGRRRRVIFEDVDIAVMVERLVNGTPVPLPLVIRRCNEKSVEEIELEIRSAAEQPVGDAGDYQLGHRRSAILNNIYYRLPRFLRILLMRGALRRPTARKAAMGTVIITSVASGLRFPGWILPKTMHNLACGLGSVVRKPRVVGEEIIARDVLHLTVVFDHDVVDGAPAARFASRLVQNLEAAVVLPAPDTEHDSPGAHRY